MNGLVDVPLKNPTEKFYKAKNASKELYLFFSGKTFEEMIPMEDVFITIYSVLAITGFIANLTMIFIVLCSKSLRNMPYNILLLNLLVSNILMAMFCIPFTLIGLLERNWTLGWFLCKTIPGIQGIGVCVSATTVTVIAFDRYIRIKRTYNVSSGSEGRYSSVTKETLIIWIVGILLGTPGAYFVTLQPITVNYSTDQLNQDLSDTTSRETFFHDATYQAFGNFVENCTYDENIEIAHAQMLKLKLTPQKLVTIPTTTPTPPVPSPRSHRMMEKWAPYPEFGFTTFYRCTEVWPPYVRPIYSYTIFILQCILPAIALVVTSGLISKHLNASRMNFGSSSSDIDEQEGDLHARNIQRNKSVTRTLLCVSISFTLCWLPIHILNLLLDLEILKSPPIHPDTLYLYVALALAVAMVSVPLNAILYGWFNPSINREVVAWKQRINLINMVGAFSPSGAAVGGPITGPGTIDKSPPSGGATIKRKNESCIDFAINLNDDRSAFSSTSYLNYQKNNHNFNYQNLTIAKSVSDNLLASRRSSISASPTSFPFKKYCKRGANLRDADQSRPAPSGIKSEPPTEMPLLLASDPKVRLSSPSSSSLSKHIIAATSCEDESVGEQFPKGESSQDRIRREGAKLASSSNGGGKIFSRSKKLIGTFIVHEQISSV